MTPGWAWLFAAIGAEVVATSSLKATAAFTRPGPTVLVACGYAVAFYAMSRAIETLPLGLSYAVWSGLGTIGAVLAGWAVYGERPNGLMVLGTALVISGTAVLHAAAPVSPLPVSPAG